MANYSYESSSSSSGGGAGGANALFNQVDANQDGQVDLGEFSNFLGKWLNHDVYLYWY
jgi:hypothetical protein